MELLIKLAYLVFCVLMIFWLVRARKELRLSDDGSWFKGAQQKHPQLYSFLLKGTPFLIILFVVYALLTAAEITTLFFWMSSQHLVFVLTRVPVQLNEGRVDILLSD